MNKQERSSKNQADTAGKHGPYYVSVVDVHTGKRQVYSSIATEQEAKTRQQKENNDQQRAHAYEYSKEKGKYVKIIP